MKALKQKAKRRVETTAEENTEEAHDEHEHHHPDDEGKPYIHEHDLQLILDEDDEPTPGFNAALVGAKVGDSREFELTFPDDAEEYQEMAGKRVKYYVDVKKIETLTLPELTDDFAARVTASEEKQLSLLELRMRVRENLKSVGEENYTSEYTRKALDQIVEQARDQVPRSHGRRSGGSLPARPRSTAATAGDHPARLHEDLPEDGGRSI